MCCTGGSLSAQHSQVAAQLPGLVGTGDAGLLLVCSGPQLPHRLSHVEGSNTEWGFSLEWEERLSLGNVKEGMWVQIASCSQHLCLMF